SRPSRCRAPARSCRAVVVSSASAPCRFSRYPTRSRSCVTEPSDTGRPSLPGPRDTTVAGSRMRLPGPGVRRPAPVVPAGPPLHSYGSAGTGGSPVVRGNTFPAHPSWTVHRSPGSARRVRQGQFVQALRRAGPGVVPALGRVAAEYPQLFGLGAGLHALHGDREVEAVGEGDDAFDDLEVDRVGRELLHALGEGAVQLEDAH